MSTFYFQVECPKCEEDIYYRVASFLEHNGEMAVPYDMMAQSRVDCPHCEATIWFGDFDDYHCEDSDGNEVES